MRHPRNKYERVQMEKREKQNIKRISAYGYKPYAGWVVIPKDEVEEVLFCGSRLWPRSANHKENQGKPFYVQYVNGGMARRRKHYKTTANRQFRRKKQFSSDKSGYKRHYDIDWKLY
jgi:hypothetical protein